MPHGEFIFVLYLDLQQSAKNLHVDGRPSTPDCYFGKGNCYFGKGYLLAMDTFGQGIPLEGYLW